MCVGICFGAGLRRAEGSGSGGVVNGQLGRLSGEGFPAVNFGANKNASLFEVTGVFEPMPLIDAMNFCGFRAGAVYKRVASICRRVAS